VTGRRGHISGEIWLNGCCTLSILTAPLSLKARHLGRKLGLNRFFAKLLASDGYEARFGAAIARSIRRGDTVWDVGANIGSYALSFSGKVGGSGRVFVFEPSPVNLALLHRRTIAAENVVVLPFGLFDVNGRLPFREESDGTTSHVASHPGPSDANGMITVNVRTGDGVILSGEAAFPNVIKIDVEGHELEVVRGLSAALSDLRLRGVFVEVHFSILQERGMRAAPRQIEQTLIAKGFRISWTDASHMQAVRSC
jgi:FkbM family methyltransferase